MFNFLKPQKTILEKRILLRGVLTNFFEDLPRTEADLPSWIESQNLIDKFDDKQVNYYYKKAEKQGLICRN